MSDNVLSVIPTDPYWQPDRIAGDRALAIVTALTPGAPDGIEVDIDMTWHDTVTVVDCGVNLERISCPHCNASIDTQWWSDLLEEHDEEGFATLDVDVPCCGASTSLDVLDYDWPCGFARFEIAVWNPERPWFSDEELTALSTALGHPVRQIRAHI
ncbi:hypothetical protein ACEZDB_12075 [Streptacidiphilus sp. N1-3]|uniref:Uncharacterized protein n=1 Tax=Streptacidiphilus alkalitolerans TaxID=3342712 RepID=A0ABV6WZ95_9ACTN